MSASAPSGGAAALCAGGGFPKIVVFDVDNTLWAGDVDMDIELPLKSAAGKVTDNRNRGIDLFPDVRAIFKRLSSAGCTLAFASRTTDAETCEAFLKAQGLWEYIEGRRYLFQAYPSCGSAKTRHFCEIFSGTGLGPPDALFFDDLRENIVAAHAQGLCSIVVLREGLTMGLLDKGLAEWRSTAK